MYITHNPILNCFLQKKNGLSRKQRNWLCKTRVHILEHLRKDNLIISEKHLRKENLIIFRKCHSIQQQLIHKTICSSDGFFLATSSCKIMNSVCIHLFLFSTNDEGVAELKSIRLQLSGFLLWMLLSNSQSHEVQMHLKQAGLYVSLGCHFMHAN